MQYRSESAGLEQICKGFRWDLSLGNETPYGGEGGEGNRKARMGRREERSPRAFFVPSPQPPNCQPTRSTKHEIYCLTASLI